MLSDLRAVGLSLHWWWSSHRKILPFLNKLFFSSKKSHVLQLLQRTSNQFLNFHIIGEGRMSLFFHFKQPQEERNGLKDNPLAWIQWSFSADRRIPTLECIFLPSPHHYCNSKCPPPQYCSWETGMGIMWGESGIGAATDGEKGESFIPLTPTHPLSPICFFLDKIISVQRLRCWWREADLHSNLRQCEEP